MDDLHETLSGRTNEWSITENACRVHTEGFEGAHRAWTYNLKWLLDMQSENYKVQSGSIVWERGGFDI